MKQNKLMLLGIALLLFGISCGVMGIGYETPKIIGLFGVCVPFLGIAVAVLGFFMGNIS